MIDLLITAQGIVRALYTEAIPIQELGSVRIERASHVEPDVSGQWWADLQPSGGPALGPFTLRSQALEAEQDWLVENVILNSVPVTSDRSRNHEKSSYEIEPASEASIADSIQTAIDCTRISGQHVDCNLQQHIKSPVCSVG